MEVETIGFIKSQLKKMTAYKENPEIVGVWIDGSTIYRQVVELTDPSVFQKGTTFKVCDLPDDFKMLIKGYGIIQTYEKSYSNNDILVYATTSSIQARQNFTGYPEKMYIIIEYIKEE